MRDPSVLGSALTSQNRQPLGSALPLAASAGRRDDGHRPVQRQASTAAAAPVEAEAAVQSGARLPEQHEALRRAVDALTSAVRASAPAAALAGPAGSAAVSDPSWELRAGDQDLVLFLQSLTVILAESLTYGGRTIWCSVTVLDAQGDRTLASSSETAQALDSLQQALADGPSLTAIRGNQLVHVGDSLTHPRWTPYLRVAAAQHGLRSVLAAPFTLLEVGPACLTIQCDRPHALDSAQIQAVRAYVLEASAAMNGVLRLHPRPAADA